MDKNSDAPVGRSLYLELMKKSLLNLIYGDVNIISENKKTIAELRDEGLDWPKDAYTMIGKRRLDNIQSCVEDTITNDIPGDLIETGVWRGGATIFMRAILKAYGITDKKVFVADSFQGLPAPNLIDFPQDLIFDQPHCEQLEISLKTVQSNFARYDLLDNQVQFLAGWFRDTLPKAEISQLSILRLDGDLYESTMDAMNNLYSKLSIGGYLIVDDYGAIKPTKQAISDFRSTHNITEEIQQIDWTGIYWKKEHSLESNIIRKADPNENNQELEVLKQEIHQLQSQLSEIKSSRSWKFFEKTHKLREILMSLEKKLLRKSLPHLFVLTHHQETTLFFQKRFTLPAQVEYSPTIYS